MRYCAERRKTREFSCVVVVCVKTGSLSRNPEYGIFRVVENAVQLVAAQRVFVGVGFKKRFKAVAVKTVQTLFGGYPHKTGFVLSDAYNAAVAQTVGL